MLSLLAVSSAMAQNKWRGDVNDDGDINVTDVSCLVNMVVNGQYSASEDLSGYFFTSAGVPSVTNGRYINVNGVNTKNNGSNPSAIYTWTEIDDTKTYFASFKRPEATTSASVALAYYHGTTFLGYEYHDTGNGAEENAFRCTLPEGTDKIIITSYHSVVATLQIGRNTAGAISEIEDRLSQLSTTRRTSLRILCFGNSFTQDSMGYLPFILQNYDIDLTIGIAAIGGGVLSQHLTTLSSLSNTYYYYKYNAGAPAWNSQATVTVEDIINDEPWDIVTLQQGSNENYQTYSSKYEPYIMKLASRICELVAHPVRLGFILTHASRNNSEEILLTRFTGSGNDNGIAPNTQRVIEETPFTLLLPYGTAIQNCRTVPQIRDIYSDNNCTNMTSDGIHLSDGTPCLAANYANALAIMHALGLGHKGIIGDQTRPDYAWVNARNIPGATTSFKTYTVTEEQAHIAQVATTIACNKPYVVTDLNGYWGE